MNIMNGFTFTLGNNDVFVNTEYKNKTEALARKILIKLGLPESQDNRKTILCWLQKATCEIKALSNGIEYYEISGENFGGRGSFVNDGNTIILKI